jgi:pimeloyl-ACP methyl ester carboxylesterase
MNTFVRNLMALSVALAAAALPARADEETARAVAEAAELAHRHVQPALVFKPCAENPSLDCGTLKVPLDYRRPWAGEVGLAVIRAKASQPQQRIGVLFANPGGPGGSGVDFVAQGVNAPGFIRLRERFDIVSFDVRGSHRSQAVRCELPRPADPATVPAAQLPALFDDFSREVAHACTLKAGPLIRTLSTNNIARDIEVLRRALHERQISYVGLSYGASLGAVYASLFPQNVRAMLLDGPGPSPATFFDGQLEFRAEQGLSFETVFQHLDERCRSDAACKLRTAGVSRAMEELLARLTSQPVVSPTGIVLNAASLRRTVSGLLPFESLWPFIVDGLADARNGSFGLMFQLQAFAGANPGGSTSVVTAFNAIQCNDFGTRTPAAQYLPMSEAVTAVASRLDGRFGVAGTMAVCAQWPEADPPLIRSVRGLLATPVLLIGTQFDPNAPIAWTRDLAGALGMERHVLRYEGGGHTAYARFGNACIDRLGDDYLFYLRLPKAGTSCPARPLVFNPATAAALQARGPARGAAETYWRPVLH